MVLLIHKEIVFKKERVKFILSHYYLGCAFFERKSKMKTKKHRLLALALILSFTLLGGCISCCTISG